MPRSPSPAHRRRRERGQAMVEYSVLTYFIALVFLVGFFWRPGGVKVQEDQQNYGDMKTTGGQSFGSSTTMLGLLWDSYQVYNNSYFYSLDVPLP